MAVRTSAFFLLSAALVASCLLTLGCESCEFTPGGRAVVVSIDDPAGSPGPVSLDVQLCTLGSPPACRELASVEPDASTWPAKYEVDLLAHASGTYCTFGTWNVEITAANCDPITLRVDDASLASDAPLEVTPSCR